MELESGRENRHGVRTYRPRKRHALPVQHQENHEEDPACTSRARDELRQDGRPVDLPCAVAGVSNGRSAHGHEDRVEEGKCADTHFRGFFSKCKLNQSFLTPSDARRAREARRWRIAPDKKSASTTIQRMTLRPRQKRVLPHLERRNDEEGLASAASDRGIARRTGSVGEFLYRHFRDPV